MFKYKGLNFAFHHSFTDKHISGFMCGAALCCSWGNSGIITGVAVAVWWPVCCAWCCSHHPSLSVSPEDCCCCCCRCTAANNIDFKVWIFNAVTNSSWLLPSAHCPVPRCPDPHAHAAACQLQPQQLWSRDHTNDYVINIHITILKSCCHYYAASWLFSLNSGKMMGMKDVQCVYYMFYHFWVFSIFNSQQ